MDPTDFRKLINIFEARNPDMEYQDDVHKVIARLHSYNSQTYTKLAQKLQRIEQLKAEVKQLEKEAVASTKTDIADLFDAEDAIKSRVVETVSVIFTLSKDPVPTQNPQYKAILEALTEHLTPELIQVLEGLKQQMVTVTQKAPSLKYDFKNESIAEGIDQKFRQMVARFKDIVSRWGNNYDAKLERLKTQAGIR